jgi:hypothetical protein
VSDFSPHQRLYGFLSYAFYLKDMRACICRKEVFVGQAVLNELKRIIEDSEVH